MLHVAAAFIETTHAKYYDMWSHNQWKIFEFFKTNTNTVKLNFGLVQEQNQQRIYFKSWIQINWTIRPALVNSHQRMDLFKQTR